MALGERMEVGNMAPRARAGLNELPQPRGDQAAATMDVPWCTGKQPTAAYHERTHLQVKDGIAGAQPRR